MFFETTGSSVGYYLQYWHCSLKAILSSLLMSIICLYWLCTIDSCHVLTKKSSLVVNLDKSTSQQWGLWTPFAHDGSKTRSCPATTVWHTLNDPSSLSQKWKSGDKMLQNLCGCNECQMTSYIIMLSYKTARLRRYALCEDALTLENLLAKACSLEARQSKCKRASPTCQKKWIELTTKSKAMGRKIPMNTFKHVSSSVWTCMAAQNKPMSHQRKNVPNMWETKQLCKDVSHQTTPPPAQPESKCLSGLDSTRANK